MSETSKATLELTVVRTGTDRDVQMLVSGEGEAQVIATAARAILREALVLLGGQPVPSPVPSPPSLPAPVPAKPEATMDEAAYRKYLHCWQLYLARDRDRAFRQPKGERFFHYLRQHLPPGTTVWVWPTVWPAVQHTFGSTEAFVAAVEAAEQEASR